MDLARVRVYKYAVGEPWNGPGSWSIAVKKCC